MKTDVVLSLALWLVERRRSGPAEEAFAGDLLETFANGRGRWWCLAQALRRSASLEANRLHIWLSPLSYCIAFAFLHPLWQAWFAPSATHRLNAHRGVFPWPASALLEISAGLLPAVLFVWLGVGVFLLLAHPRLRPVHLLLSLSVGCGVVSLETVLRLGTTHPQLCTLSHADFYYPVLHAHFSALLFLGLFAAIAALPASETRSGPQSGPGQRC